MKKINNWLNLKIEPRKSDKTGMGEYAIDDIKKGEILAMFGGHIMTREERDGLPENIRYLSIGIDEEMFIGPKSIEESDSADFLTIHVNPM